MTLSQEKTAALGLALLLTGNAFALGLGEATGQPVLGQPLRLEIPLLGSGGSVPAANCFSVQAPQAEIGNDFALRHARILVVGDRGGAKLVVTTANGVREPIIGFAIAAACGFGLAKDYVLLSAMPTEAPQVAPPPAVAEPPGAVAPPALKPAPAALPAAAAGNLLRIDAAVTLEALARQKYPLQPKAREKFMRMMAQANPGLTADESLIAAGTELNVPAGLPQRRTGPYLGEAKAAPADPAADKPAAAAPPAAKPGARTTKPGQDRLVLGAAPQTSETKLLAEAERLAGLLLEQNKAQDALLENIAKLEGNYGSLQKDFARLQERLGRIETERIAEKQAAKSLSLGFFELLLAVLAGGAGGGFMLYSYQRWQLRRTQAGIESSLDAIETPAPLPATAIEFPWSKHAAPATTIVPAIVPASASATEPISAESACPETLPAASAAPEAAAASESTPVEAVVVGSSDLDSLSLEFSLEPNTKIEEEPPATDATTDSAAPAAPQTASVEPLALDFPSLPVVGEAPPDAAGSPEPQTAAADGDEVLSLDFPPILPAVAAEQEDSHVVEFVTETADKVAPAQNALDFHKNQ